MGYLLTGAGVIIIDQLVKYIIRANMFPGDSIAVIGDFFRITYVRNPGAAFGMFSDQSGFLRIVPLLIIILASGIIFLSRETNVFVKYALLLIIAGGAGNLIDRYLFGSVTDMFSFSIFPPVFNVADIAVTCGTGLLIAYVLFGEKITEISRKRRKKRTK